MVFRFILRYFANNEQLIQRMSESYPMRRAAQLLVGTFYRTKMIAERNGIKNLADLSPERFQSFFRALRSNLKEEIDGVRKEIKPKDRK